MAQCEVCGTEVAQGRARARRTCSAACRQKAHRQRQARQVAELRAAAARPTLALVPPTAAPAEVTAADGSPAGRIRAAGAELASVIELAAEQAARGYPSGSAEGMAWGVETAAGKVLAAIRASAPDVSRDEPAVPVPASGGAAPVGSSRDELVAVTSPEPPPTGAEPSRDEPAARRPARRKRLTRARAQALADSSRLVKHPEHRDNHRWNLVAEDGTVLGHVEPSYSGTGRNGWRYQAGGTFVFGGPCKTRDAAAVQCALSWMRLVTTPAR